MAFVKIDNNNFERITLNLKPEAHFISSSVGMGVTGSSHVSPFRSQTLKQELVFRQEEDDDGNVELVIDTENSPKNVLTELLADQSNLDNKLDQYMGKVNSAGQIIKNTKTVDIFRFDQPVSFNKNRTIKNVTRKVLMPYYRHHYDNCEFSYGNYHTLNFFSSDNITTGSALLYPNVNEDYDLPTDFSINFWVNPRRSDTGEYKSGTILHLSSSICVSIVSGSGKDSFNAANRFKLMIQLSQSADLSPSSVNLDSPSNAYPNDLIFTSSHFLEKNYWHHVCVQWGSNYNNRTGSIFIDDNETKFYVNSASLASHSSLSPAAFVVGNYFDAQNSIVGSFLNSGSAENEGFLPMVDGVVSDPPLREHMLAHPFNGEVHEIKMYNKVLRTVSSDFIDERESVKLKGPPNLNNLVFYVPPFFYPDTPSRQVLLTPFQKSADTTDDPFNVSFSFGVNGKMINLENFTREFVKGRHPRLLDLVPSTINTTVQDITADQYVYASGSIKKRNMTIMPNDNGLFTPNYFVLSSSPFANSAKWNTQIDGAPIHSIISLENLVLTSSLYKGLIATQGEMFQKIAGSSPENPGVAPGSVLTIAQRTRDVSSNEITIADISNLYYGNKIHPGSFIFKDDNLTGSDGKMQITLRDNERGSLYRADSVTPHAKWNSVGNIFYNDGIVLIKSPHLFFFGKDKIDLKFKGEQNLHTMILNVPVYPEMFTSSSNPTYVDIAPTTGANNQDLTTKYITTVNIHDDNLNIIMKAHFSQPIFKTEEDEFIIRLKEDF
jgi:hypothetical protein